ncbi:leukocyte elastase inhibitor A [Dermacentor silvarum]|uniref:leukocyte elastase inhibitor A n=1 Tax=Dermacentor silvarum TaxID=543639 RepID=UPI002101689C|nr:leukocyte elastase inhibitor A [Dermacentor silvarum]
MYQLLQSKNAENENVVCSAFSVACSLAMLAGGAGGSTSKQIFALLSLKASKDRIREHFSNLLTMLSGCAPDATFLVANRLYSDKRFPVQSGYVVLLESSYGATLKSVDFSSSHEVVRREANAWIKEQTASKVQDMLRPGSVDSRTVLVHISAIAFKSFWQFPFRSINTMPQDFRLDYKTNVRVNMMFLDQSFKIGHSEELGARALEIPYRGQKASMVILLPDEVEGLFCLEESMTSARISTLLANMKLVQDVEVSLPKFKLDYTLPLKETLKDLGVKDLFTPGKADLSGIFESGRPAVSEVIHKAAVEVYEEGTEPAASTTVVIESTGTIAAQAVRFVVDHPFMFLIKSNEPEVILFMGSVRKL